MTTGSEYGEQWLIGMLDRAARIIAMESAESPERGRHIRLREREALLGELEAEGIRLPSLHGSGEAPPEPSLPSYVVIACTPPARGGYHGDAVTLEAASSEEACAEARETILAENPDIDQDYLDTMFPIPYKPSMVTAYVSTVEYQLPPPGFECCGGGGAGNGHSGLCPTNAGDDS